MPLTLFFTLGLLRRWPGRHFARTTPWGAPNTDVLKVASHSNSNSASGAIVGALEHNGVVELHAIGAGAVSQTVKAVAIARRLVERPGKEGRPRGSSTS